MTFVIATLLIFLVSKSQREAFLSFFCSSSENFLDSSAPLFLPMFHVEHVNMQMLIMALAILVVACNRPEPNPELRDPIYMSLLDEKANAEKLLADAEKTQLEHEATLEKVKPQTGQIRYAQKRLYEGARAISQLQQQIKYWTLRIDTRRDYVRRKSYEAHVKGEKWESGKEHDDFLTEKRFRQARKDWDAKGRREAFLKEEGLNSSRSPAEAGNSKE